MSVNMLPYRVRRFRGPDREYETVIMTDLAGSPLPCYQPNLFATSEYEQIGASPHTIEKVLRTVGMAKCWATLHGRDFDADLSEGQFIDWSDVVSLTHFLSLNAEGQLAELSAHEEAQLGKDARAEVQSLQPRQQRRKPDAATLVELATRLRWVAKYCEWHRHRRFDNRKLTDIERDLNRSAERAIASLRERAPSVSAGWHDDELLEAPDPEVLKRLEQIFHPDSSKNPFASDFVRWRNYLAWRLLVDTGARRSEVWQSRSDSVLGPQRRFSIAHSKTTPRTVPIVETTADVFSRFFHVHWLELPDGCEAHRTGALFTDRSGRELTSGKFLNRMFVAARKKLGPQPWSITPHAMRRAWNHILSLKLDGMPENKKFSPEQEAQTRIRLMGWAEGSRQAMRYNRRHIRERADEIAQSMMDDINKK